MFYFILFNRNDVPVRFQRHRQLLGSGLNALGFLSLLVIS